MKTYSKINLLVLCSLGILAGCSSTPQLKQPPVLNTKAVVTQYYYCESCPKPTKLVKDTYVPIEPEPVIISNPIIVKKEIKKHKKSHRKLKKSKSKNKPVPQCVLWK